MGSKEIEVILTVLDQAFDKKSWHGTNLRGSLRGVTHVQASWRPSPDRHNIWELTLHTAYWKYIVRRRLLGEPRGSFPLKARTGSGGPREGRKPTGSSTFGSSSKPTGLCARRLPTSGLPTFTSLLRAARSATST